jgi:hypothetical protein
MLAIMPKHKGTDKLRAELRTKIARLSEEAQRRPGAGGRGGTLYSVKKEGAGQAVLVGLPNGGKSLLFSCLTGAEARVADYPFTTQFPAPGMMRFENVQIQIVDIPPLSERSLPPWVYTILRGADILLLVIDLSIDPLAQVQTICEELGRWRIKLRGKEESLAAPEVGVLKKALIVGNKGDLEHALDNYLLLEKHYGDSFPLFCVSAREEVGLEELRKGIFEALEVVRVYTKAPGREPDLTEPVVLKKGSTVEDVAEAIHKEFRGKLKYAQIWGSGKFGGQRVGRDYIPQDGDIIELRT